MTRREQLLRESMDLALLSFRPTAPGEAESAFRALAASEALWRTAQALGQVDDGGDRGATERWFSDIEELAASRKPKAAAKKAS